MRSISFILLFCALLPLLCPSPSLVGAEAQHRSPRLSTGIDVRAALPHKGKHRTGPLDTAFRRLIGHYRKQQAQQPLGVAPVYANAKSPLAIAERRLGLAVALGAPNRYVFPSEAQHMASIEKRGQPHACASRRSQQYLPVPVDPQIHPGIAVDSAESGTDEHKDSEATGEDERGSIEEQTLRNSTKELETNYVEDSYGHSTSGSKGTTISQISACFPALAFQMPSHRPSSLDHWWCNPSTEHAFLGFSYQVEACPSRSQLISDFRRMRNEFHARYVRMYGACDTASFNDDMIEAAWEAGVGIYPLIWFGFDGDDKWKSRKRTLMHTIKSNPKAAFVIRGVVVGSEPLFDTVLPVDELVNQMEDVKATLDPFTNRDYHGDSAMQVTLSDMSYSFQKFDGPSKTLGAATILQANVLPFFSFSARYGYSADALAGIKDTFSYLKQHSGGQKKIIFAQTGWPSNDEVWKANSATAVASVDNEAAYFRLLDRAACHDPLLRNGPRGGLAWFAHIWSDQGLPGWGVLDASGKPKFHFRPRTSCS